MFCVVTARMLILGRDHHSTQLSLDCLLGIRRRIRYLDLGYMDVDIHGRYVALVPEETAIFGPYVAVSSSSDGDVEVPADYIYESMSLDGEDHGADQSEARLMVERERMNFEQP